MHNADMATVIRRALGRVADGRLGVPPVTVRFWDGSTLAGESASPLVAVRSPNALGYLLREPNQIELARAWVTGALDIEGDLDLVLATGVRVSGVSLSARDRLHLVFTALRAAPAAVLQHPPVPSIELRPRGRRHSAARDRAAVTHHYDMSNDFYRLILGPSMVYSCAYFDRAGDSLESAQERKHEIICRKLRLTSGERLLDIGCGWGSLLLHAATRYGVRGESRFRRPRLSWPEAGSATRESLTWSRCACATTGTSTTGLLTRSSALACTSTSDGQSSGATRARWLVC